MGEKKWTPQQRSAIGASGGTVLVSAAAGSGKTAVLVQRVIERLTSNDPKIFCDADRLLIVTFTRAAASEMKAPACCEYTRRLSDAPSRYSRPERDELPADVRHCAQTGLQSYLA